MIEHEFKWLLTKEKGTLRKGRNIFYVELQENGTWIWRIETPQVDISSSSKLPQMLTQDAAILSCEEMCHRITIN